MGLSFALRMAADKLSPNNLPTELKLIGGEKLAILWRGMLTIVLARRRYVRHPPFKVHKA
jgi:hypothetical protein